MINKCTLDRLRYLKLDNNKETFKSDSISRKNFENRLCPRRCLVLDSRSLIHNNLKVQHLTFEKCNPTIQRIHLKISDEKLACTEPEPIKIPLAKYFIKLMQCWSYLIRQVFISVINNQLDFTQHFKGSFKKFQSPIEAQAHQWWAFQSL